MNVRIEKTIEIKAPVSRVWRALTDHREFGTWFRVRLEGPFVPGKATGGQITYPGYEHVRMEVVVQKLQPERLFASPGIHSPSILKSTIRKRRPRWSSSHSSRQRTARCCASSRAVSTRFRRTAATRLSA